MAELIIFPDAETQWSQYFREALAERDPEVEYVGSIIPSERPGKFVRVLRTGGTRRDLVTEVVTLTVEAWAQKSVPAERLAQLVRALIHACDQLPDGAQVYTVDEYGSPANLPDPLSDQARYTASYAVAVRGRALA